MERDIYQCASCGLKDKNVECVGIFHCPNDLCKGSGAAYFRHTLQSFKEEGGGHSVDEIEWLYRARKSMKEKKPEIWTWVKDSGYLAKFVEAMED